MLYFCRCRLLHINHASINIATSILGGRWWHGIWRIRWSPTGYWRSLKLMRCAMWRAGWMLTNRGQLSWINDWIIQWRRHRYHWWWKIIALWFTVLAIKSLVITRSVVWRSGWLLTNWGQLRWIDDWIIQWRRKIYIAGNDNSLLFEWQLLQLKYRLSRWVIRCLSWLFLFHFCGDYQYPCNLSWWMQYEFVVVLCACYFVCRWPSKS